METAPPLEQDAVEKPMAIMERCLAGMARIGLALSPVVSLAMRGMAFMFFGTITAGVVIAAAVFGSPRGRL